MFWGLGWGLKGWSRWTGPKVFAIGLARGRGPRAWRPGLGGLGPGAHGVKPGGPEPMTTVQGLGKGLGAPGGARLPGVGEARLAEEEFLNPTFFQ